MTKYLALDALNIKYLFSTVRVAEKSKIKELANSLSGDGHLPSLQTAASHLAIYIYISFLAGRERAKVL